MSINVTVTGNPISIKRGKMVTSDSYQCKKEFDKRRLMRLEQVRQQSKDIAENVRNKVRKEKKKQMRQIEEEGKQKLKNWQNRKLLELQTQYEEALQELGTGHKEAMDFIDETEILAEQKKANDKIAAQRGQVAATELQIEKNKENLKKAIPVQQKKIVRDIENTRASLVSSIKKSKSGGTECNDKTRKRKQPIADINISIPSSDSESLELGVTDVQINSKHDQLSNNVDEREELLTNSCDCTDISDNTHRQLSDETNDSGPDLVSKSHRPLSPNHLQQTSATGISNLAKQIHERRKLVEEFRQQSTNLGPPLDTRISDRIKRRELMASQPDYCDTIAKTHPMPFIESNTQLRDAIDAHNINNVPVEINCICGHKCPKICGRKLAHRDQDDDNKIKFSGSDSKSKQTSVHHEVNIENEIPDKPPLKLKDKYDQDKRVLGPSKDTLGTYDSHKVKYYDHPNRFSQEKRFPSNAHVEKISGDSLEVIPDIISEEEWQQKMKQRDREAQIRGQKALEKERIQKDYEEMLKKLPLLQKKERICEIAKDKQEYHMSDERLKEKERKKQNELDNAFSKLFPNLKPAVVTLPSKAQEPERGKPVTNEPIQSLNLGSWDVDREEPKMFTMEEVQEIVKAFTVQNPKDRRTKLKQLLKSLKMQKEQLLNEIKCLPSNDSINELINDLKSFSDSDEKSSGRNRKGGEKSERKRRRDDHEKEVSTDSTTESSSSSSKQGKEKNMKNKHKGHIKTPSPRKKQKIKYRKKVLILQNTSTQTTPKASTNSEQVNPSSNASANFEQDKSSPKASANLDQNMLKSKVCTDKEKPICPKLHVPCDCNKENESTEELCQIVIKINENENPEVIVKSKEKNVTVPKAATKERSPIYKKAEVKSVSVGTDDIPKLKKPVSSKVSSEAQETIEDKSEKAPVTKHKTSSKIVDPKKIQISKVNATESKAKSWREQLSKNSVSTSSTSYFSPPDFQKMGSSQAQSSSIEESKKSFYNLHKKPQQSNLRDLTSALSVSTSQTSIDQRTVDPRILSYIQRLLSMSRGSVDNLTVSTSSVQTPSQSVIEIESNNPLSQLHDVIKSYNLKDIEHHLSYSPDFSPIHYNTSASTSEIYQPQPTQEKSADFVDNFSKSGRTDQSSKGTVEREISSCSARSKDSILAQYADITDSCSKRIAQLASMIEQLREEKIHMLQNPPAPKTMDKTEITDKDYSTAYLDLPSNDSSSKYSSVNSLDDEELQRRLLDIDFSLAEKLRKFSSVKQDTVSDEDIGKGEKEGPPAKDAIDEGNDTNTELWSRLNRLTQEEQNIQKISIPPVQAPNDTLSFVPFLSDIPKLPKLEVQTEDTKVDSSHKRPPPSKGLSVAKKFNGNISLIPHELSTIVEADSQISTKLTSANNSRTSQDISPRKDFQLVVPQVETPVAENSTSSKVSSKSNRSSPVQVTKVSLTSRDKCDDRCTSVCSEIVASKENGIGRSKTPPSSPVLNLSSEGSNPSVILTCSKSSTSKKSIHLSSSSSDDMETIETMLRSIGMEWAIPTLHKTKEALALTSSSSSLEFSSKKQVMGNSTSGSEVSLKQYLKKQIKISSSTLRSDASPASFSADLSELSSIQGNYSNGEKSHQKTSTPVVSSKSTDKSKKRVVFSEDSDLSSVRDETQKHSDKSSKSSYRSLTE